MVDHFQNMFEIGAVIVLIIIGLLYFVQNKFTKNTKYVRRNLLDYHVDDQSLKFTNKKFDCEKEQITCLNDDDCANSCFTKSFCSLGKCRPQIPISEIDCNIQKGFIGVFQFNRITNQYEKVCQSIDPGIADSTKNNKTTFCLGGNIKPPIDYTIKYPEEDDCQCPQGTFKVPVLGNTNRRLNFGCLKGSFWGEGDLV